MWNIIFLLTLILVAFPSIGLTTSDVTKSVIKIVTISTNPDYNSPWSKKPPEGTSGSGCLISGKRILTNAHVVSNGSYITVQAHGKAKKYKATVNAISHDADLALLTVENQDFYNGLVPLEIGDLPKPSQQVVVYGYPEGGESLSTTTGVISRIEHINYPHSLLNLLGIQVDAAINNGNSGGPAVVDNKIAGISMAGADGSDNIAYLVPSLLVRHFLADLEDGKYDGFPTLGIRTQEIENDAMRAVLKLPPEQNGALVNYVMPGFSSDQILRKNDVLLSVGSYEVGNDAKVEIAPSLRTALSYAVESQQVGDMLKVKVFRDGKEVDLSVPLVNTLRETKILPYEWDSPPKYYIFGGLVFISASSNLMDLYINDERQYEGYWDLASFYLDNTKRLLNEEIVMLSHVMPDLINEGYQSFNDRVIVSVNGQKIYNMRDLIRVIDDTDDRSPVTFETIRYESIILSKAEALIANSSILKQYGIPNDRSACYYQ